MKNNLGINENVLLVVIAIFIVLIIASITLLVMKKVQPTKNFTELQNRISSWWFIVLGFCVFVLWNKTLALLSFSFLSFLALKEYLSLISTRRADRRVLFFVYLAIPIHYYWIFTDWYGMFIIFIPVYVFLFIHILMILIGETKGFLKASGTIQWGLMITVFGFSHLAALLTLSPESGISPNLPAGHVGLVLFIVLTTQLNDVFQYLWGKSLGKHKIIPKISPNKTVEGFLGGVVTTTLLSVLLAPLLTPFSLLMAILAGVIIGIGGFMGDLTISAFKRDMNIKDTGNTIPGHGGLLDRIDSLTFTAPVFFHFLRYFYF